MYFPNRSPVPTETEHSLSKYDKQINGMMRQSCLRTMRRSIASYSGDSGSY